MPTLSETMTELENFGAPNIRKIYIKHGLGENTFGVKFGDMKPLAKRIKTDHALALQLWETGNHDARILAGMIADPKQATPEMLEKWAYSQTNYAQSDELSKFVSKTPHARAMAEKWSQEPGEWVSTVGWNVLGQLAVTDKSLPDSFFEPYIAQIEHEIHDKPNRTRYAMNGALIAFGMRSPALEAKALAVGKAIGEVYVDHGETGCETPDACSYIQKAVEKKGHLVK